MDEREKARCGWHREGSQGLIIREDERGDIADHVNETSDAGALFRA